MLNKQKGDSAMLNKLVDIYCTCYDVIHQLRIKDDIQSKLTKAEIMTVAIVAHLRFGGNIEAAGFDHKRGMQTLC